MPIILPAIPDPSPPIIAGEQLRVAVTDQDQGVVVGPMLQGAPLIDPLVSIVANEDNPYPMEQLCEVGRLSVRRMKNGVLQYRANAGIATPCGAWVTNDWSPLLLSRVGGYARYSLSGVSRDSAGAALGGCTVKVFLTGNDTKQFETVSDGSGNWSIDVGANPGPFYYVEYKVGSPDRAGTSINTNVPAVAL